MASLFLSSLRLRPLNGTSSIPFKVAWCERPATFRQCRNFKALREPTKFDDDFGVKTADSNFPPYPYGPRKFFKQADKGLYGGAQLQFGNKISKGRNKGKTRRTWHPNVKLETIHSDALDTDLTLRITHSCMRTIKKCGGLDQYLLGEKPARIKELGILGWKLRWKVMNSSSMKKRYKAERENMGLPPRNSIYETFQQAKFREDFMQEIREEQADAWENLREKDTRFQSHVKRQWTRYDGLPWRIASILDSNTRSPTKREGFTEPDEGQDDDVSRETTITKNVKLDPLAPGFPEYGSALG